MTAEIIDKLQEKATVLTQANIAKDIAATFWLVFTCTFYNLKPVILIRFDRMRIRIHKI